MTKCPVLTGGSELLDDEVVNVASTDDKKLVPVSAVRVNVWVLEVETGPWLLIPLLQRK